MPQGKQRLQSSIPATVSKCPRSMTTRNRVDRLRKRWSSSFVSKSDRKGRTFPWAGREGDRLHSWAFTASERQAPFRKILLIDAPHREDRIWSLVRLSFTPQVTYSSIDLEARVKPIGISAAMATALVRTCEIERIVGLDAKTWELVVEPVSLFFMRLSSWKTLVNWIESPFL